MQTNTDTTGVIDATNKSPGFDQMAQGLKTAIDDFSVEQAPAYLSMILSAIRPLSDVSLRAWKFTSSFVRRHPVQATIGIVALGFLAAQFMKSGMPRSKDGRQY